MREERCRPTPPPFGRGLTYWVRAKLHRRIFAWFGASIVMTGASVWLVLSLASAPYRGWHEDWERLRHFVGHQYAVVWDDPAARDELARTTSDQLDVQVVLEDARGHELSRFGARECRHPRFEAPVIRGGREVGRVEVCAERAAPRPGWLLILGVVVACGTLWAASGVIARRLVRPLSHVVQVARDVGTGKLGSRVRIGHHRTGELGVLADAIDDMAARIEKQLRDQRELLAAVSHEIRTPLGHIRILLETARDGAERGEPLGTKTCDELEREVLEIDDLVGELLASSRLSFDAIERRPLEALDLGARALERAGLSIDLLESDEESVPFDGDATLLGRALANLLENAKRHAGGIVRLVIERDVQGGLVFAVDDDGPGFAGDEIEKVFDPFYRGERRAGASAGSLGLGLSLVRRIAQAHGGRAWAENRRGGGARVAFRVAPRQT
ncbi:HAMP domain-containing sensor histidine kinase [Sandaracinus amylolyticus]|uniref:histidine kinase n=1 Tax=Sandaracinus amylolyticus TaxID=927083 RepID=A0A0F6WAV0_9BACT|nr:HAMP domain-containing sensor histidine kinase [Sandaracinus amylolyticus]AKF11752.1 periplasmic sensor signal transduction histidine kinase [Sandaracinus amylolyticus]